MNLDICPWEAIDSERQYLKEEQKPQKKIKKQRPKTATFSNSRKISNLKETPKKSQKDVMRKQSTKYELEEEFFRLKSEQLPLSSHHRNETHFTLSQSQFKINEKNEGKKIHWGSSQKKLFSAYRNHSDKLHKKVIKHEIDFYQSQHKRQKPNSQHQQSPPHNKINIVKYSFLAHQSKKDQELLLNRKFSKLLKRVKKRESLGQPTITVDSKIRKNGFVYFNQQIV